MNRHHGQGNSYKGKHLIGSGLPHQRLSASSWQKVWWQADVVLEKELSTASWSVGRGSLVWAFETPLPLTRPHKIRNLPQTFQKELHSMMIKHANTQATAAWGSILTQTTAVSLSQYHFCMYITALVSICFCSPVLLTYYELHSIFCKWLFIHLFFYTFFHF